MAALRGWLQLRSVRRLAVQRRVVLVAIGLPSSLLLTLQTSPYARAAQPRIIGGGVASLVRWPWMARVLINNPNGVNTCSGTLVARNVVLTAGHCASNAWRFEVVTGTTSATAGGQVSRVTRVVRDPAFKIVDPTGADLTDYDATLLKLATPVDVQPVTLATTADPALYRPGGIVSVAGWGWVNYAAASASPLLQSGTMALVGQSACLTDSLAAFGLHLNTADQICALSPTGRVSICEGDSGGPLIAHLAGGQSVQIGITIWNSGQCSPQRPDYFTSTAGIGAWLKREIPLLSGSASAQPPLAGSYRGRTRQHQGLTFMVSASRREVRSASTVVTLHCTRLSIPKLYKVEPHGARYWPHRLSASGRWALNDHFTLSGGWHVNLRIRFTGVGRASGSIMVSGADGRDGVCRSGTISWDASLGPSA